MRQKETVRLSITAIFTAILIIQTLVPNIGYVRILPTLPAVTTIPLTISIYGILMGARAGFIFGLFWGITRLVVAFTQPGDMVSLMLFQNPVISIVPSVLAGWVPALISNGFKNKNTNWQRVGYILSGAATSLTNTIMVILLTSLFFMNNSATLMKYLGNTSGSGILFNVLVAALGMNGLVEAIFTGILTPIIVVPLTYVLRKAQI